MKEHLGRTGKRSKMQDIRNFFHGTVTDRAMRQWLDSESQAPGEMAAWIEEIIEREETEARESGDGIVRWRSASDRREMTDFCVELVNRLEPILGELVLPYDYEPAKRFKVPLSLPVRGVPTEIMLSGEMDILGRAGTDEWFVWDLKATKDDGYWRKTIGQLAFYDLAVTSAFGAPTQRVGLIQPMCKERVMDLQVSDQQRVELVTRIARYVDSVQHRKQVPTSDSKYCSWCAVKHACPKFSRAESGRVSFGFA